MTSLIFAFSLIICVGLFIRYNIGIISFVPILLLLWDALTEFIPSPAAYLYLRDFLILLLFLYTFLNTKGRFKAFGAMLLLLYVLILSPLTSANFNNSLREFAHLSASIILLPISYNYFKNRSNINQLINVGFWFIIFWSIYVLLSTAFEWGGESSERFGSYFYFGGLASHGGLTYIVFMLFLIPLFYQNLSTYKKVFLVAAVAFVFVVLLIALKRFVFVGLSLAFLNYFLRSRFRKRMMSLAYLLVIILPLLIFVDRLVPIIETRYYERGEKSFEVEEISQDKRLLEIPYAIEELQSRSLINAFFGDGTFATFLTIEEETDRKVHNTYVRIILAYGVLGLVLYLILLFSVLRFGYKKRRVLFKKYPFLRDYYIVFLNLMGIFILQGVVGGHAHVTYRGIVLIYSGAILGLFTNYYKKNHSQRVSNLLAKSRDTGSPVSHLNEKIEK